MKLILTSTEVKAILLEHVNHSFTTQFNDITFDGYSPFKTATFEITEPESTEVTE